ncbi:hypothetical protein ACWDKQ_10100 [Saccharopolyspora sp. NPDC000995]
MPRAPARPRSPGPAEEVRVTRSQGPPAGPFCAQALGFDLRLPRWWRWTRFPRRSGVPWSARRFRVRDREDIVATLGQSRLVAFHRMSRAVRNELYRSLLKAVDGA